MDRDLPRRRRRLTRLSRSRPRRRGETGRGTSTLQGKAAWAPGCRRRGGGAPGLSPCRPSALDAFISITRTQAPPPSRSAPAPGRRGLCSPPLPAPWCREAMAAAAAPLGAYSMLRRREGRPRLSASSSSSGVVSGNGLLTACCPWLPVRDPHSG